MANPIRTLLFSTLYPNNERPSHGIFVETRMRHLLASGEVETRVFAHVPWFPFQHKMFGDYAHYAAVSPQEESNGIRNIGGQTPINIRRETPCT
jgi:teichuronic acid biosynthesis glycosyltransferase TuaC